MAKKKTVTYQMIQTTEYVEDSGYVVAYGISCQTRRGADVSTPGEQVAAIPGISTQPELVEGMVEMLNLRDADPLHLKDLVYDFLP